MSGYRDAVRRDRLRAEKEAEAAASSSGNGMQLAFHCEVKPGPNGELWVGLSFGMGTGTYTLGLPVAMWESFKSLVTETGDKAIADAQSQLASVQSPQLIVPS